MTSQTLDARDLRRENSVTMGRRVGSWLGKAGTALLAVLSFHPFAFSADDAEGRTVSVLYAGSLAGVMENGVGPAFKAATGLGYQGEAQGSLGAGRMIRDGLRQPDVFISADPLVNDNVLMGPDNHNLVAWYVMMASSQLVVAYNPKSEFAAKFEDVRAGKLKWYEVLEMPGLRMGRGYPRIDPKGYRTLFMFNLAADHYKRPQIAKLLGDPLNPDQVFPEVGLVARLEAGQLDAGIFYMHEAVAHKMAFIKVAPEESLGDAAFAASYAKQSYMPKDERVVGAPIVFTITIPKTVKHREAARALVKFMLSSEKLLTDFGFGIVKHTVTGDAAQMPAEIKSLTVGATAK